MTGTTDRVETRPNKIYKVTQVIDGREVVLYTDKKPANP